VQQEQPSQVLTLLLMEIYTNGVVSKMVTNLGPQVQHQHRKTASFQRSILKYLACCTPVETEAFRVHKAAKETVFRIAPPVARTSKTDTAAYGTYYGFGEAVCPLGFGAPSLKDLLDNFRIIDNDITNEYNEH
jgi:hypothetical protein